MANGSGDLWTLMTVFGVIVLGCAIAYAMIRNRAVTREASAVSERATTDLYKSENQEAGRARD